MKTAISILQEMLVLKRQELQFDLIYQGGPPHQMIFKYQCTALGASEIGIGRSKKDAKQEAARLCLEKLAQMGVYKPSAGPGPGMTRPPPPTSSSAAFQQDTNINSYVSLLREYCEEYRMPAPVDVLVSDTGPPHCREFVVSVTSGSHTRSAAASTKKAARQLASQKLYLYFKENLTRIASNFNEEEALVRANQKVQDKYVELRDKEGAGWRPNLGQKYSEAHLGLKQNTDLETRLQALQLIDTVVTDDDLVEKAEEVLDVLGLKYEHRLLPSHEKYKVVAVLNVREAHPPFALASPPDVESAAKQATAKKTLEYLKVMLE